MARDLSGLKHLILLLPIFAVVLIALGISQLSLSTQVSTISTALFLSEEGGLKAILMNAAFFLGVAVLNAFVCHFILKRGWVSLIEKLFAFTGGLLTLFFGGVLSVGLLRQWGSLYSFMLFNTIMFLIGISIAFLIADVFSEKLKNVLFLIYGSVTGCFLGIGIPLFSMIFILISLCIIDAFLIKSGLIRNIIDLPYEERISVKIGYSTIEYEVGIGDILYYSMLTSYSVINFGALTAIFSALLILGGCLFTIAWTTKGIIPGLPIPIGLGLIPIVMRFIFLT